MIPFSCLAYIFTYFALRMGIHVEEEYGRNKVVFYTFIVGASLNSQESKENAKRKEKWEQNQENGMSLVSLCKKNRKYIHYWRKAIG